MRFNFDRETNTRLDADQLAWLEKILIRNTHANVTLIGSSIQVIPDYYRVSETFAYKNKRLLFDLLNKYKKSNVLILSGDVHYAQFYSSKCKGFVGGYKLWEFTSSGLSHTQADFQIGATPEMELLTHPFWTESDIKILPNFGQVDIDLLTDNSIDLHLTAFGIHGEILLQTTLNTKQMQFNEKGLQQNAKMCQITHEKHQLILHLAQFMQHLVGFKNPMTLMYLQVLPLGMVVLPITFGVYIFRKLCQRMLKIC
ncbi:hypothetical protein FGO68_gene703 [Halteria grandinella]|uniref:PhoD-like phosphatase metallophosphatase domain-containing protein n=1 Tax=Halteria grandinella TaxID=5974 RepID=A0A8J8T1M3_HALGN|nr:hypothetical protein FGO68_gene703 [Halteria grandinella]